MGTFPVQADRRNILSCATVRTTGLASGAPGVRTIIGDVETKQP